MISWQKNRGWSSHGPKSWSQWCPPHFRHPTNWQPIQISQVFPKKATYFCIFSELYYIVYIWYFPHLPWIPHLYPLKSPENSQFLMANSIFPWYIPPFFRWRNRTPRWPSDAPRPVGWDRRPSAGPGRPPSVPARWAPHVPRPGCESPPGDVGMVRFYLVNIQKAMENHHFWMGKSSISMAIFKFANC